MLLRDLNWSAYVDHFHLEICWVVLICRRYFLYLPKNCPIRICMLKVDTRCPFGLNLFEKLKMLYTNIIVFLCLKKNHIKRTMCVILTSVVSYYVCCKTKYRLMEFVEKFSCLSIRCSLPNIIILFINIVISSTLWTP